MIKAHLFSHFIKEHHPLEDILDQIPLAAERGGGSTQSSLSLSKMADDEIAQEEELLALKSIYEDERIFMRLPNEKGGELNIFLEIPDNFLLKIRSAHVPSSVKNKTTPAEVNQDNTSGGRGGNSFVCVPVKYLPPVVLNFELPRGYPSSEPPSFTLSCTWLTRFQVCFYL